MQDGNGKKIIWTTEKRKVKDLLPDPINPREISSSDFKQLKRSIEKFNYVEPVAVNLNGRIIAGHMRVKALIALKRGNEEIDVRVPSRALSQEEATEYLLRSNKNRGDWDYDKLANEFDLSLLVDVGFTDKELEMLLPDDSEMNPEGEEENLGMALIKISLPKDDEASFLTQLQGLLDKFEHAKLVSDGKNKKKSRVSR